MLLKTSKAAVAGFLLLAVTQLSTAAAHGSESAGNMQESHGHSEEGDHVPDDTEYPPTYFSHASYSGVLYAHVSLMILAWVFVLPIAVMLSIARSRYTLLSQTAFTAINGVGILLATIYNAQTPDLYPNNAHHKVGWVVTWVMLAQFLVSALGWVASRARSSTDQVATAERSTFLPMSASQHEQDMQERGYYDDHRLSDEHQESGPHHSPRSSSASTVIDEDESLPMPITHKEYEQDEETLNEPTLASSCTHGKWTKRIDRVASSRIWVYFTGLYKAVDRVILPLGFVAVTTGIAAMGRFFEGKAIFNGLAHWVKGGIFFWLGIVTLGRWAGSFGDLGWAWNIRPRSAASKWRPSAEFVESALIFFYGSTNIFMEHLGHWGGKWRAQDFEHLSITVLFIGGGLCGMLIESTRIRDFLNVATVESIPERLHSDEEQVEKQEPATYRFSLNPFPALVILLLGVMMSSHHQETMTSTMVHKQWGNLLTGASFARGLTYVLVFLRPPTSVLPSRPPTELLASFGLIAGGIIFMASSSDTIDGMIHYDLDAMFLYTVTMGFVGLLMAWEIIVLAIKGLASRRARGPKSHRFQ